MRGAYQNLYIVGRLGNKKYSTSRIDVKNKKIK